MQNKTLHLVTGLPRSGGSLITSILSQNPEIHSETNSTLSNVLHLLHQNWNLAGDVPADTRKGILRGILAGYYDQVQQQTILDRSLSWVPMLPTLENLLGRQVKVVVCVRNPAEILTSYERSRAEDPMTVSDADLKLRDNSSIASRAFYYSGPDGIMGVTFRNIQDAIIMGYLDRMLFVDYGTYCANPRSQTKRIYDFLEMDDFQHDFNNITPHNPGVRTRLSKVTVNCVQYLGLDLFEQYNKNIFWNAWV